MCTLRAVYDLLYLPIDANPMGDRLLPPHLPIGGLFFGPSFLSLVRNLYFLQIQYTDREGGTHFSCKKMVST